MTKSEPKRCRDEGDAPGCLGAADERFTMRFDDIGEPPIHWCAACGQVAHAMQRAIDGRLEEDPGFAREFERAIKDTVEDARSKLH